MNFGTGIAVGFVVGIGAGMASGRRNARDVFEKNLRNFSQRHRIMIQTKEGQSVSFEEFLNDVLGIERKRNKTFAIIIGVGIAALLLGMLLWFLVAR